MDAKEAKENGSKANISLCAVHLIAVDFPSYFYIIIASVLYTGTICRDHFSLPPIKAVLFFFPLALFFIQGVIFEMKEFIYKQGEHLILI